ncbi:MAG: lysophospholipid acyltransferase family protein [Candidatus Acidiferrales bacterium]
MKHIFLVIRSVILWAISGIHFVIFCLFLMLLAVFIDPRKHDWLQRLFFRNILRLIGVKLEVRCSPGFDPKRTSIFISNHVNLFDPFVVYSSIPQFFRGFELESHFKIPVYGWLMKRFGNVPVPADPSRSGLEEMIRRAKHAIDSGISLIAFAEGSRTRNGHVGPFRKGIFRIAQNFGCPIVPMSIVGSFEFFRTGHWMIHPGRITVYLHDIIETNGTSRKGLDDLRMRVHAIVSKPVEDAMKESSGEN